MRPEQCLLGVSHLHQAFISILFLLSFFPTTSGLYVVSGSNCTSACFSNSTGSGHTTNRSDVRCYDSDYSVTNAGIGFQGCVACELQSHTFEHTTDQTDIGWALFNIKYTLGSCLFNYPGTSNGTSNGTDAVPQCKDACSSLSTSVEANIAAPKNTTTYDFCEGKDSTFLSNLDICASCYKVIQNQRYISNYLNVLRYACQYRPNTSEAFPIPPSAIFTLNPPSNYSDYPSSNNVPATGLNAETKTAIAISVPVCFFLLLSLALVCCYTHRQTKGIAPPSGTLSKRSEKHVSKSTDTEKGWSRTSRSPPKHASSEKRSTTRSMHGLSRGPSNHLRANNSQLTSSRSERRPASQPPRTRSSQSQADTLYYQASTSPQAPNPTTDTLVTTYTTPSASLHSIPILAPSRYEPPVPTLGPSPRWDDIPPVPTLLPPLRSSPLSRSTPPSRSGRVSHSEPPSRSGPPSQPNPSSHHSTAQTGSPSKRKPNLPPPSRWETPQTRNLPPLSRYTLQQPQTNPHSPHTHYEEPPQHPTHPPPEILHPIPPAHTHYEEPSQVPALPPPETYQPMPPRSMPLQVPNTQPLEEVGGPSQQQILTLPPPPPTNHTPNQCLQLKKPRNLGTRRS